MLGSIQARRRQRPARARRSGWLLAALVAVSGCTGEEASACSDLVAEAAAEIVELRDAAAELTREDLARLSGRAAEVTGPYIEVRDELRRRAVAQGCALDEMAAEFERRVGELEVRSEGGAAVLLEAYGPLNPFDSP